MKRFVDFLNLVLLFSISTEWKFELYIMTVDKSGHVHICGACELEFGYSMRTVSSSDKRTLLILLLRLPQPESQINQN